LNQWLRWGEQFPFSAQQRSEQAARRLAPLNALRWPRPLSGSRRRHEREIVKQRTRREPGLFVGLLRQPKHASRGNGRSKADYEAVAASSAIWGVAALLRGKLAALVFLESGVFALGPRVAP